MKLIMVTTMMTKAAGSDSVIFKLFETLSSNKTTQKANREGTENQNRSSSEVGGPHYSRHLASWKATRHL